MILDIPVDDGFRLVSLDVGWIEENQIIMSTPSRRVFALVWLTLIEAKEGGILAMQ